MSQARAPSPSPSAGRMKWRWSIGRLCAVSGWHGGGMKSMAGLPELSAWVSVGPPLPAGGSSRGFVAGRSSGAEKLQVPSLSRL